MPDAVFNKATSSPHFQSLRAMHGTSFDYIAYSLAQLISCLMLLDILLSWYHEALKQRPNNISRCPWRLTSRTLRQKLALEVLFWFLLFQAPIIVLISLREKQNIKPQIILFQPRIWLLGLTLWNALAIEVYQLYGLEKEFTNRT